MREINAFIFGKQPMDTINRGINTLYCLVLIAISIKIGLSFTVVALFVALLFLHFGNQKIPRQGLQTQIFTYILLVLEVILLIVLCYGSAGEWVGTIFLIYTAGVMLNYPASIALLLVYAGYFTYQVFLGERVLDFNTYFFNLINFSLLPLSLLGVRTLIVQRQRILDLNQRIQLQAELSAEMSKLRERNRLAEAMHDTIGHTLTAGIVSLEGVTLLLEKRPAEAVVLLDSVREQLQAALGDIRQTVRSLKTDTLGEGATLKESLVELVERVCRQTTVKIDLQLHLAADLLPIQEYLLYTIVREAITNALKHGQATCIQITLAELAQHRIALTVIDNGKGTESFAPSFGLTHLEQKVQALGGTLTIESQEHAGFCIQVVLPLTMDIMMKPRNEAQQKAESYD